MNDSVGNIFWDVRSKISTIEIAEEAGVRFRQVGSKYVARCPFHKERMPSFTIFPDGGFKCFGCGISGQDGIALYAKLNNLRPLEAAKELAGRFGIEIEGKVQRPEINVGDVYRGVKVWRDKVYGAVCEIYRDADLILKGYKNPEQALNDDKFIENVLIMAEADRLSNELALISNDELLQLLAGGE